jgi:hypothetical protein
VRLELISECKCSPEAEVNDGDNHHYNQCILTI